MDFLNDYQLSKILNRYETGCNIFTIPFSTVSNSLSELTIIYYVRSFNRILKRAHKAYIISYLDNQKNFMFVRRKVMDKAMTFTFDYGEYDHFLPVMYRINQIISSEGMVQVFANNDIYHLSAGLIILEDETRSNLLDQAKQVALSSGMIQNFEIGRQEILKGMVGRQYNAVTLLPNESYKTFQFDMQVICQFKPKSQMKDYISNKNIKKPKLFVSYCHKDQEKVREVIAKLREYELDFWVDEEQIDYGDNIMSNIDTGMQEMALPIIFLSKNTLSADFASFEFNTFLNKIIYTKEAHKKWLIVKLDNTDLSKISMGLNTYKYFELFDINNRTSISDLGNAIKSKLKLI